MRCISDQLIEAIIEKKCPVVVGLDPRWDKIPHHITGKALRQHGKTFRAVSEAFIEFNRGIIDAVADIVPCVKPQIAFYEQYGIEGLIAYKDACDYARMKGLIVIADVKRGDIGSTSKAYATAYLGMTDIEGQAQSAFYSDFATVNPYLGDDCLKEFVADIKTYNKGMFVLVKTSNPTSGQLQDLLTEGETFYEKVADIVGAWNEQLVGERGYSPVGAVVGATYPIELETLRKRMPKAIFLVPGYGAQGGGARDVLPAFNEDGLGAVINSSRGILYAYEKSSLSYEKAAREAAVEMRDAINKALETEGKVYWE